MNEHEIEVLLKWWMEIDTQGIDATKYFINPLMESFGDDVNEIITYRNEIEVMHLDVISGCFEAIYRKFTTNEVYDALTTLENKIVS